MKDMRNQELYVGATVVFKVPYSTSLKEGKVTHITSQKVRVSNGTDFRGDPRLTLRYPTECCVVPEEPTNG